MRKTIIGILICAMLVVMGNALCVKAEDITATGMSQKARYTLFSNTVSLVNELKANYTLLRNQILNQCYDSAGWSGSTTTLIMTSPVEYSVSGIRYFKTAATMTMTTAAIQAQSTYCLYLLSLSTTPGADVTVTKGTAVATDTAVLPEVPTGECPVGYVKIWTESAAFTSGTTSLGTLNTPTYYNISVVPSGDDASAAISASDLSLTGL